MNKIIILFILLFCFSKSEAQWVLQNSGSSKNLNGISTFDGINAVAVGDQGTVTTTSNAGVPYWNVQRNPTDSNLNCVVSISPKILLAFGPKDTIYRSSDHGVSWNGVRSAVRGECWTLDSIHQIFAADYDKTSHVCVAVGDVLEAVFSLDSGKHWQERIPSLNAGLQSDLHCVTQLNGMIFSAGTSLSFSPNSQVMNSQDEGNNWQVTTYNFGDATLTGCDLKTWILVGSSGLIFHSRNGGITWDVIPSGTTLNLNAVCFAPDSLNGFIAGDAGLILSTRDGGYTWTREYSPTNENLRSVSVFDPFHAYICGDNGVILWTQDGGFEGVKSQGGDVAINIETYPNPLSSKTTIQVFLQEHRHLNLRVYNILGEVVADIANDDYDQGLHNFEWNAADLPNGIYICRLESEGQSIISRMIVAK